MTATIGTGQSLGGAMSLIGRMRRRISSRYKRHGAYSRSLDRLNRLPLHQAYMAAFPNAPSFTTREALWDAVAARRSGAIDYLEFGVHQGHSILHWAGRNQDPKSRFVGFDTFTGLPEQWNAFYPQGHFDTGGQVPQTDDPRVDFVTGLFQDTLPGFLANHVATGRPLVVHIDCDLYASALYCLTRLDTILVPGSILIFDEFGDVLHEFRAFADYLASYRRNGRLIATHDDGFTAAIELA